MTIKPTKKYDIVFAKTEGGEEIKFRFVLTTSKPIRDKEMAAQLVQLLEHDLPGIDGFNIMGRYTMEIIIARTFDAEAVVGELQSRLDTVLNTVLQPSKQIIT